jgi:hypothetical protein
MLAVGAMNSTAPAAGSAFIRVGDHDAEFAPFFGAIHGPGYVFANQTILSPGISFLSGISGGQSGGANGDVLIGNPANGLPYLELVAVAVRVSTGTLPESLTASGDVAQVVNDLNTLQYGEFGATAYAFNAIPAQYNQAAAVLAADESALGRQPFDLLFATTVHTTAFGSGAAFWDFALAGEVGAGAPFTQLVVTDIGVIPEPGGLATVAAVVGFFAGSAAGRRGARCHVRAT